MRCTGQSPNSALLGEFIPEALDQWGFVKVQSTTQVDAGSSNQKTDNIYVVGDVRLPSSPFSTPRRSLTFETPRSLQVADAKVIKAGHTGWNQAEITIQNIMSSIMCKVKGSETEGQEPTMAHYKPSPPQIKVTLGLVSFISLFQLYHRVQADPRSFLPSQRHSCSELLPAMDAEETIVAKKDDGPIDSYWSLIWSRMGISTEDLTV